MGNLSNCFFNLEKEFTPREVYLLYSQYLNDISSQGFLQKITDLLSGSLAEIINLYEEGVYSRHKLTPVQVRKAQKHLNKARFHALLIKAIGLFFQA